jgi:NADH-quinone oxidoreductase subunit D
MDGEIVVRAAPEIGYLHSGIEKSFEGMTYQQVIPLTGRIDYLCPLAGNLCYVLAVERLLALSPPPRAVWTRVLLGELARISSHLAWLGSHAKAMGLSSVSLFCFHEREEILSIFALVSGERLITTYFQVGGLSAEAPPELSSRIRNFLIGFSDRLERQEESLTSNPIWMGRTRGVGVLSREKALNMAASGPTARASGIDWDLRRDMPYSGYEQFRFTVPVRQEGDVNARFLVRMQEIRESVGIAGQALDGMPSGPFLAERPKGFPPVGSLLLHNQPLVESAPTGQERFNEHLKILAEGFQVPAGEVYQAIESPRGEMGCYVVSDGTTRPCRVKVRGPSFAHLQALPQMSEGLVLADLIASLGSLDLVPGEIDR